MLQCKEIDELMMDWLYQELDASSSQAVEAHVGGCARCTAEVGSLRRTREVFRGMPPEEPPAALSAILLHEAARRAPAVAPHREQAGFWDRVRAWFQPLIAHPAAAAMATLMLVAGVAGLLYVRKGSEMTDVERANSAAPSPVKADAPAASGAPAGGAVVAPAPTPTTLAQDPAPEPMREDAPADGYEAGLLDARTQAELSERRRKPAEAQAESKNEKTVSLRDKERPLSKKMAAKPSPRGDVANAISGADPLVSGVGESGLRGRMETESPKAPPPAAGPSSTATASTRAPAPGAAGDSSSTFRPYKDQKPLTAQELKWLDGQQARLSSAVKSNRCNEAARIANDILDRSPEYYVQRNPATQKTQPCQTAVVSETNRRRMARSKNVGSGSSHAAPQQKMKSAPREADEAAAEPAASE